MAIILNIVFCVFALMLLLTLLWLLLAVFSFCLGRIDEPSLFEARKVMILASISFMVFASFYHFIGL